MVNNFRKCTTQFLTFSSIDFTISMDDTYLWLLVEMTSLMIMQYYSKVEKFLLLLTFELHVLILDDFHR